MRAVAARGRLCSRRQGAPWPPTPCLKCDIMTWTGSRYTKIHGVSGKAAERMAMFGTVMLWNLKKSRSCTGEAPMSAKSCLRTVVRCSVVHDRQWLMTAGGGADSEYTRFVGTLASMFAMSVEPTRDSWNTNPDGESGLRSRLIASSYRELSEPLLPRLHRLALTRSRNMGVLVGLRQYPSTSSLQSVTRGSPCSTWAISIGIQKGGTTSDSLRPPE
mmetsp:Transcript_14696/g.58778  ORF Transcript_14696/g.58778 Transcript_14696/m.58778 type:complete len:217 (-) Transcript_14696:16-666(-)